MGNVRVIDVHQSVYAVNNEIAAKTRARLKEEKTFMVNLMSSPGAGKTTTLIRTANMLGDRYRIGVMKQILILLLMLRRWRQQGLLQFRCIQAESVRWTLI